MKNKDFVIDEEGILIKYNGTSKEVVIPDGVVEIGAEAFEGCEWIEKIVIPASVESVCEGTFADCVSVKKYVVDERNGYMMSVNGDLYSKDGSMLIRYASGKRSRKFSVPDELNWDIEVVWFNAFRGSSRLVKIDLDCALLHTVCPRAFKNCENLERALLPYNLKELGAFAFQGCRSLRYVRLRNINTIQRGTFLGCVLLKRIKLPLFLNYIEEEAFFKCESLESVSFPYGFTRIGSEAFLGCISLKKVTFRRGLIAIEDRAFYDCGSLESVVLPDTVNRVGRQAFCNCENLELKVHTLCLEEFDQEADLGVKDTEYIDDRLRRYS